EDAREVDVRAQATQLGIHLVMVGVELVELRVDVLRLSGCREQGGHGQDQQTTEADGRDRPRAEAHGIYLRNQWTVPGEAATTVPSSVQRTASSGRVTSRKKGRVPARPSRSASLVFRTGNRRRRGSRRAAVNPGGLV